MFGKRKAVINSVALLVSLALLLVSVPVAKGWDGVLRPLLAAYTWSSSNTDATGYFYNSSSGRGAKAYSVGYTGFSGYGQGTGVYGNARASNGSGVYGYCAGSSCNGVVGYGPNHNGVLGQGGTGSGDYGGYFYGFEGVRGIAVGSNGFGTWGHATGSYGIGAYGYSAGSRGIGAYGYNYHNIGVYGYGCGYGVYGYARCSSGRGVYGYTAASAGEGVRGYTAGYCGDGVTAYATNSYGYGVDSAATGYGGHGIRAQATGTGGWGGLVRSAKYRGLFADGAPGYYDAYFPDAIYAGGTVVSGSGMSFIALNDGSEALEPGDLVALSSFVAADASSEPVMAVARVNGANSGAFLGVVQAAYVMEAPVEMQPQVTAAEALDAPSVLEKELAPLLEFESFESDKELPPEVAPPLPVPPGPLQEEIGVALEMAPDVAAPAPEQEIPVDADSGYFVEGSAEPGQYVLIVVQGIARVNVDASAAPVQAGDTLVALGSGYATAAAKTQAGGLVEVVIGRALEALEAGKDAIYVFVNVR